jgi:hypothetical protein
MKNGKLKDLRNYHSQAMKRTGADRPKRKEMTSVSAVLSAEKK